MEKTSKNLLIVDDNRKYKDLLVDLFIKEDYNIHWVQSAGEARRDLDEKGISYYKSIVTDITMESQTSGLFFAIGLRKKGFKGRIIIASTGFDFDIVLRPSLLFLSWFGIDALIPKQSLLSGQPRILACANK